MYQGKSLAEKIKERESEEAVSSLKKTPTVNKLSSEQNRTIVVSMRVNEAMYSKFKKICKEQGLSYNSALNMILHEYVRNNRGYLELDDK